MKRLGWVLVVAVAGLVQIPTAFGQCPSGVVTVGGKIENLPPETASADVVVVLKTPKGDFSKTAVVTDGQFRLDVNFRTLKSWSPLRGHRCSNIPKLVEVTVRHANHVFAQEELKFADSFETRDSLTYSLRRELTLDASKRTVPGKAL